MTYANIKAIILFILKKNVKYVGVFIRKLDYATVYVF